MNCLEVRVQRDQHAQEAWQETRVEGILPTQWHAALEASTRLSHILKFSEMPPYSRSVPNAFEVPLQLNSFS